MSARWEISGQCVPRPRGGQRGYSYLRYQESREIANMLRQSPEKEKELVAKGKLTAKQFDEAVAHTPKVFYVQLVEDLRGCRDAFQAFSRGTDAQFGANPPSLLNLEKALDECANLLEPIFAEKRKLEPDLEPLETPPGLVPPTPGESDHGRVLINFLDGAQQLAEVGARLKANREQYAALAEEMRKTR